MAYLGDYTEDYATLNLKFTTRTTAGVPSTLGGTPVISVYKANGLVQSTAGITLTVDFDGVTGLNNVLIDLSADVFYAIANDYQVVITTGTVNGVSVVGEVVGEFSIENRFEEVTVTTNNDKTGYSLAATGLDAIVSTATGMVEIAKAVWDRILTGATHNIATSAGRRLRGIQENGSVYNGEVHVDTNNGVTGVIPYENGTSDNATLTWAEALIIAPAVNGGLSDFHMINGSSITLTANTDNKSLFGDNYSVALGGQSCADIFIQGASVSGIGTAATGEMHFDGCNFGISSIQSGHFDFCAFADTITATLTGGYQYHNCYSGVPGAAAPIFTKTAGQTITSEWRNWSGGITVSTIEAGDVMTIGGTLGTVTLNGANGTVEIRGTYKAIVDNRTGSPTLNIDGALQCDEIVDKVWDEPLTGVTHNATDSSGKRIRDLQEWGSYEGGAIFIDTVNGTAGTTDYESGTILNPVDTITDANTLATSLTLSRFEVAPSSSITLAASQVGQVFKGVGWTLALGGQDVSDSEFIGVQSVTGTATTTTGEAHFVDCELVTGTLGQSHLKFCGLGGTLTLSSAANYTLSDCYSQIPGSPTPIIDFGAAVGNTGLSMRRYSGGVEVQNYGATGTDTMSLEGNGQLVIAASCTGGTIYVRGNFKVTDNAGGAVSIVYDDNSANAAAILVDTNELQSDWTNGGRLDLILDAILADTSTDGVILTAAERLAIADAILDRDMATGADSGSTTVRTVRQALRANRNKVTIAGGTMTVYEEDDATASWTAAITTSAGDPISDMNPAGGS